MATERTKLPPEVVIDAIKELRDENSIAPTPEISEYILDNEGYEVTSRTVLNRLGELEDEGVVESHKIGSRLKSWRITEEVSE